MMRRSTDSMERLGPCVGAQPGYCRVINMPKHLFGSVALLEINLQHGERVKELAFLGVEFFF